jgi:hypothetical protein
MELPALLEAGLWVVTALRAARALSAPFLQRAAAFPAFAMTALVFAMTEPPEAVSLGGTAWLRLRQTRSGPALWKLTALPETAPAM